MQTPLADIKINVSLQSEKLYFLNITNTIYLTGSVIEFMETIRIFNRRTVKAEDPRSFVTCLKSTSYRQLCPTLLFSCCEYHQNHQNKIMSIFQNKIVFEQVS